jgi:hypothetical protein
MRKLWITAAAILLGLVALASGGAAWEQHPSAHAP